MDPQNIPKKTQPTEKPGENGLASQGDSAADGFAGRATNNGICLKKRATPTKNDWFFSCKKRKKAKTELAELCVQVLCFTDMRRKLKRGEGVNYEIQYCQQVF